MIEHGQIQPFNADEAPQARVAQTALAKRTPAAEQNQGASKKAKTSHVPSPQNTLRSALPASASTPTRKPISLDIFAGMDNAIKNDLESAPPLFPAETPAEPTNNSNYLQHALLNYRGKKQHDVSGESTPSSSRSPSPLELDDIETASPAKMFKGTLVETAPEAKIFKSKSAAGTSSPQSSSPVPALPLWSPVASYFLGHSPESSPPPSRSNSPLELEEAEPAKVFGEHGRAKRPALAAIPHHKPGGTLSPIPEENERSLQEKESAARTQPSIMGLAYLAILEQMYKGSREQNAKLRGLWALEAEIRESRELYNTSQESSDSQWKLSSEALSDAATAPEQTKRVKGRTKKKPHGGAAVDQETVKFSDNADKENAPENIPHDPNRALNLGKARYELSALGLKAAERGPATALRPNSPEAGKVQPTSDKSDKETFTELLKASRPDAAANRPGSAAQQRFKKGARHNNENSAPSDHQKRVAKTPKQPDGRPIWR